MRIPRAEKYFVLWGVCMCAVATLPGCAHVAAVGMVFGGALYGADIISYRADSYPYECDATPREARKHSFLTYMKWRYFPGEDQ